MNQQFLNCEMEFECSKDWFKLEPTNKAGIKYCIQCHKDVRLCMNQEELDQALEQKICIAFFRDPSLSTQFKLSREKCMANGQDPEFEIQMTIGYPSSDRMRELRELSRDPNKRTRLSFLDEE